MGGCMQTQPTLLLILNLADKLPANEGVFSGISYIIQAPSLTFKAHYTVTCSCGSSISLYCTAPYAVFQQLFTITWICWAPPSLSALALNHFSTWNTLFPPETLSNFCSSFKTHSLKAFPTQGILNWPWTLKAPFLRLLTWHLSHSILYCSV